MERVQEFIQLLGGVAGTLAALLTIPLFIKLRWPAPGWWFIKLYASAWSRMLTVIGALCMLAGLTTSSVLLSFLGIYVFLFFFTHVVRVTRPPGASTGFDEAFGMQWKKQIKPELKNRLLPGRTLLTLPAVPDPRLEQNICFATLPNTNRKLWCDVWQPPSTIKPSGLAFIYLHGSAWYLLDKDYGTRPLFQQLASQGHVIMDVAYRLAPETDIMGMVHDVKHAIVWMKEHRRTYGIHPDQVAVGGGSAGAHLALLAAYTANDPHFTPSGLEGKNLSVCGVISLYGPTDLETMYFHTNQHLTTRSTPSKPKKSTPAHLPLWMTKAMGNEYHRLGFDKSLVNAGALAPLLGGHPDECPETYALFSPVTHVHADCPPTLLIHGEHDLMAPVKTTCVLYARLVEANVPTVLHVLRQTDHAFDLINPRLSPSAHNAIYDIEYFLALMASKESRGETRKITTALEELHV